MIGTGEEGRVKRQIRKGIINRDRESLKNDSRKGWSGQKPFIYSS